MSRANLPPQAAVGIDLISAILKIFDQWLKKAFNRHVDPYVIWALMTKFRGFGYNGRLPGAINFLVELKDDVCAASLDLPQGCEMGCQYLEALPNSRHSRYVTVRVPVADHSEVGVQQLANIVLCLVLSESIQRIQVGFPQDDGILDSASGIVSPIKKPGLQPKVVLAALDYSCPFAHMAFRNPADDTKTRVVAFWDQSKGRKSRNLPDQHIPYGFSYGTQWSKKELQGLLGAHHDGNAVQEDRLYTETAPSGDTENNFSLLKMRASHGGAVLPLMAGRRNVPPYSNLAKVDREGEFVHAAAGQDPASSAPFVLVQLPSEQIRTSSSRWFSVHTLDALRYQVEAARRLSKDRDRPAPLVVNISAGGIASAHDGTGLLEAAMDELCDAYNGDLAIVLAAGNFHGTQRDVEKSHPDSQRLPSGVHASRVLTKEHPARFHLWVPEDKPDETYLEIWFSTELSAEDVMVEVDPPGGLDSMTLTALPQVVTTNDGQSICSGLIGWSKVAQSTTRSMMLLVVSATQAEAEGDSRAVAGEWKIKVTLRPKSSKASVEVQAWVERDDIWVAGVRRPQSARLMSEPDGRSGGLTDENTLSSIATGKRTFRVGALTGRHKESLAVSAYSSQGANSEYGPQFSAPVDVGYDLPGMWVSGTQSGMILRATGTSLAAPQVARWIANRLAANTSLKRIRKAVKAAPRTARVGKVVP